MLSSLESYLSEITGFHATSLQPNSGPSGEYCGQWYSRISKPNGDKHKKHLFNPLPLLSTNPASAVSQPDLDEGFGS